MSEEYRRSLCFIMLAHDPLYHSGTFVWKAYTIEAGYVSMNNEPTSLTHRPIGVTILAVLFIIGGAFALIVGIGTLAAVPFAARSPSRYIVFETRYIAYTARARAPRTPIPGHHGHPRELARDLSPHCPVHQHPDPRSR